MRIPVIQGVIRRRILANFRIDPDVMQRQLPGPFRPKLQKGWAIAGICLIRLEGIRPKRLPLPFGIVSENAAHRVAVTWEDPASGEPREGVYIPRRDTSSWLNHLAGGRLFPGEHHHARFDVQDRNGRIALTMRADDGQTGVEIRGREADALPSGSCFTSLEEASTFFECGSCGYSATSRSARLDGIRLETMRWEVHPLEVELVHSRYFEDPSRFPPGSAIFDHALLMRDIPHEWHTLPDLETSAPLEKQEIL